MSERSDPLLFLIHVYFGMDLSTLWQIVQIDLPLLDKQLKEVPI